MKKLLLLCLCITPLMVCAAANNNNNPSSLKEGQLYLFHGRKALQQGNFERAKSLFQKSAALGYPGAIEALADLQQIIVEQNQQQGPRGLTVKRGGQ